MGAPLYVSSINYGINVPQFHYYVFHKVGPEVDDNMLTTISKTGMRKIIMNSTIHLQMRKGL